MIKNSFWSIIRHFVKNNNNTSSIPPLKVFPPRGQNDYYFTDKEKAECLYEYFTSVSTIKDANTNNSTFHVHLLKFKR